MTICKKRLAPLLLALLLAVGAALTILYAVPILWAAASYFGFTT